MTARDPLPAQAAALNAIFEAANPLRQWQREQEARKQRHDELCKVIHDRALEIITEASAIAQGPSFCRGSLDLLAVAFHDLEAAALIVDPPWEDIPEDHHAEEYRREKAEDRERSCVRKEPT